MQKKLARTISLILSTLLVFTFIPSASFAASADSYESNNSMSTAKTISQNVRIYPTIHTESDVDYFKFVVQYPGDYSVIFSSPSYYYMFEIQDKYGYLLGGGNTFAGETDMFEFELTPGTYYICVYSDGDSSSLPYSLTVSDQNNDIYELNNSRDTAKTLSLNKTYAPILHSNRDSDYFKLSVPSSSTYYISLESPFDEEAYLLEIQNASGDMIGGFPGWSGETIEWDFALSQGTYYIVVYTDDTRSLYPYFLTVRQ